ncbi:zinc ribbon domain-containing protein [Puniceicoccales bacterium CK1056]|uniref:Zinc ribbon domain-containing protein n=1 Tax=Oceanipulchritudo coccoides TaxID=2706888 RepID=A0A6B2M1J9_9BACT|nr:FmdB family zinc ribbon protein [Oceanipulchritudo coccoides]NDV62222.1 zinc ribbon domain-containing protein [Oceanipulchritudo coccoides]
MPTYEYTCQQCGHDLEVFQRMSDDPLQDCPECQTPSLKRKIGLGAGIIFKGGGFYETDFKDRKGQPKESSPGPDKSKKADDKSGASSEKKSSASSSEASAS